MIYGTFSVERLEGTHLKEDPPLSRPQVAVDLGAGIGILSALAVRFGRWNVQRTTVVFRKVAF